MTFSPQEQAETRVAVRIENGAASLKFSGILLDSRICLSLINFDTARNQSCRYFIHTSKRKFFYVGNQSMDFGFGIAVSSP